MSDHLKDNAYEIIPEKYTTKKEGLSKMLKPSTGASSLI